MRSKSEDPLPGLGPPPKTCLAARHLFRIEDALLEQVRGEREFLSGDRGRTRPNSKGPGRWQSDDYWLTTEPREVHDLLTLDGRARALDPAASGPGSRATSR